MGILFLLLFASAMQLVGADIDQQDLEGKHLIIVTADVSGNFNLTHQFTCNKKKYKIVIVTT